VVYQTHGIQSVGTAISPMSRVYIRALVVAAYATPTTLHWVKRLAVRNRVECASQHKPVRPEEVA